LMQNGRELLSVLAQELDELSISIRLRLLTPPPVSIIWLLLSADLCLNKFLPLPNTLQQFYAAHLDLTIDESFSEVTYGSWKKTDPEYRSDVSSDTDKASQNLSQISLDDDSKPKLRPILGAGAGLLRQEQMTQETFDTWTTKTNLTKRYDLNSWRQPEEKKDESEPVFNPTVLPPNMQNYVVPDYPPPNFNNYPENYANYLQQGDGTYIQNYQAPSFNTPEFVPQFTTDLPNITQPERVNSEIQQTANVTKPVENWRREKSDLKEDSNMNKKNWTRQQSKDSLNDEEKDEKLRSVSRSSRESRQSAQGRLNRRNSGEGRSKTPPKRHVTEVPRNHKYWDHDDRCDKDYNS
ncbi:jg4863, partial [Pararge aegeria aegeria]